MNIPKSNLHTHTTYCDGKNRPIEIVETAMEIGMDTLGFSEHARVFFDAENSISIDDMKPYREEITDLKARFDDRIQILLGLEQDLYSEIPAEGYDYLIGSCHYLKMPGEYVSVDYSPAEFRRIIDECFGGNVYAFTREYFEQMVKIPQKINCDIIGHFDLISKFNGNGAFFDECDRRYLDPAMDALDELLKSDRIFEINTGAASRGWRDIPYPGSLFLRRIAERGGRVTFSSDSHAKETLMFGFDRAVAHAQASGVRALTVMTRDGWKEFVI